MIRKQDAECNYSMWFFKYSKLTLHKVNAIISSVYKAFQHGRDIYEFRNIVSRAV